MVLQKFEITISHVRDRDDNIQDDIEEQVIAIAKKEVREGYDEPAADVESHQMQSTENFSEAREIELRELEKEIREAMTPKKTDTKNAKSNPTNHSLANINSKN